MSPLLAAANSDGPPSCSAAATDASDRELYDVIFKATVNAPLEAIDLPNWCFFLSEDEYRACSPDHIAAGFTTALDGRQMSVQFTSAGKNLLVHHYVETIHRSDCLVLESLSEMFTPTGRTTICVEWDLRVAAVDHRRCEFTNRVRAQATNDFLAHIAREGIPFLRIRSQHFAWAITHNKARTPLLAASIERAALRTIVF